MPKITAAHLIRLKQLTPLTIAQISENTGIPLGTVQKIFAGITKTPRQKTAALLYDYLYENMRNTQTKGVVSENIDSSRPYDQMSEGTPSPYLDGTLARPLRKQGEYTIDDYRALPDDQRCELIDGYFYDMSAPSTTHQRIVSALTAAFYNYIHENGSTCEVFPAPVDVQLDCDEMTMVQPDLLVVCDSGMIHEWGIFGAPDLVIEVLSPSTERKDRALKTMKYANAGVREYWLVDPSAGEIFVHRFDVDVPVGIFKFGQEIPVGIYDGKLKIVIPERRG